MAGFVAVLSPAKLMDEHSHYVDKAYSAISFPKETEELVNGLRKKKPADFIKMMDISSELAEDTARRFKEWKQPVKPDEAIQAILLFRGEVYRGLSARDFTEAELSYAQNHLRILSGLYGVLRPLDLIMPYRLMMGSPYAPNKKCKNLYEYWSEKVSLQLLQEVGEKGQLLDLASAEYFKVINRKKFSFRVLSVEFLEQKGKDFKQVATYSKLARGRMARFLVKNAIKKTSDIRAFEEDRYGYNEQLSTPEKMIFTRSQI